MSVKCLWKAARREEVLHASYMEKKGFTVFKEHTCAEGRERRSIQNEVATVELISKEKLLCFLIK